MLVGAFLEVLLIIANIGTTVALFPILKRHSEVLALGYVTARLVESGFIAVGILSLVTVVTLRREAAAADAASLAVVGQALVAIHDWTAKAPWRAQQQAYQGALGWMNLPGEVWAE